MVEDFDFDSAKAVVEFGPGMGTFTNAILDELPPGWLAAEGGKGRFIAIEFNRRMAVMFRRNYPGVSLHHDDAANVVDICLEEGVKPGTVDCVISGLGWPSFSDEVRTRILEATHKVLRPGGEFRTFGYHCGLLMRGAWHFRSEVRRLFREVEVGRVVWGNMPPAFVYRCVK